MDMRRRIAGLLYYLKQLNLFDTYSTDPKQIEREIITTRIYLFVFPTILTILIVYSAQKERYHTVEVNNPSIETYQQLFHAYPYTLLCPCSQLAIPYSSFLTVNPQFHSVCSSDFVMDRWLQYLYYDDASSYIPYDIRSVGSAQFQLLRTLCQSSSEAITNGFKIIFASATLVNSRGTLLSPELVGTQIDAFTNDFIIDLGSKERRQRAFFATFFERNFLVSGWRTSSMPEIDKRINLTMGNIIYARSLDTHSFLTGNICSCENTYECIAPLGIYNSSLYELDIFKWEDVPQGKFLLENVDGFLTGCLPLNSLLQSTLECYYNQSCLNRIMNYLHIVNTSFTILNPNISNQSSPMTSIGTLVNKLMVEKWSKEVNYSRYFAACRPLSCTYTYTETFSILYIVTTLIGLIGGLITILRILCPQLTNAYYLIQKYIFHRKMNQISERSTSEQRQPLKMRINQILNKLYNILLTLNLFARRNSNDLETREQILTTRFYIGCLFVLTVVLVFVTTFEQRIKITTVSMPTTNEFENLFQSGKLPYSCPCSEIAIQRSKFITLIPTFHPICSSELLSQDWIDHLTYISFSRTYYHYLDIRSYGVDMFETILSFCLLANETTMDGINSFLSTNFVTTQVLPHEKLIEQIQAMISDFQLDLHNTFKRLLKIASKTIQGDQVLTNRISNFFMNGLFDNRGHLISIKTYTGALLFGNNSSPLCSCLLNECRQQINIFDTLITIRNVTSIAEIPGMYTACYPLDALQMSTLECWFNKSCMNFIWNNLESIPIDQYFNPLDSSDMAHFSINSSIGEIIENLMIDRWANSIDYEEYYNVCRPLTCTYTSYRRFDWLYTVAILTSVIGGLSVALRIACPLIIKIYFYCRRRRKRSANKENKSLSKDRSTTVRTSAISRTFSQVRQLILTLNVFDSDSPHAHIRYRERLSTRVYIITLAITILFLFVYMLFVENMRTVTVNSPLPTLVTKLHEQYPTTLSCPCTQTSMPYYTVFSLRITAFHPICSSSFLSRHYLEALVGDNLAIVPESISFKKQFFASQLSLLASYCTLINETINSSLSSFLHQQFINSHVLTMDQFYQQIHSIANRFLLDVTLSFRHSLDYFQAIIHENAIMSSYLSNWHFITIPVSNRNSTMVRMRPVWYGNCSCAISRQCSIPFMIDNVTFQGLALGCLPSSVLLQSTLECLYNQTCLDTLHHAFFNNMTSSALPLSINVSRHFPPNTSVGSLIDDLFVEEWLKNYDYEAFFRTCQVLACTYTYNQRPDILYVVTTIIGLFGGLNVVFRLICPLITIGSIYLIDRIRKKSSIASVHTNAHSLQTTAVVNGAPINEDAAKQQVTIDSRKSRLNKIITRACIIIIIFGILLGVIIAVIKRFSSSNDSNLSITMSTRLRSSSTMTVPVTALCSERAIWKREGVTVAGFDNDTAPTSLSGLTNPTDIYIDSVGNMHIVDSYNNRILYWPVNSIEGRIVIGTNESGSAPDHLSTPSTLIVFEGKMYVLDVGNNRIQSFPFTTTPGSPNGITILGESFSGNGDGMPMLLSAMALDRRRGLLYVFNSINYNLLIFNITENGVQILVETQLLIMDSDFPVILPSNIIVDEASGSFYLTDVIVNGVIKFEFGSATGKTIAGGIFNDQTYNSLWTPTGITLDSAGYVYVADSGLNRIVQLLNENGELRTIAGIGLEGSSGTRLDSPTNLKFDQYHNLYVVDTGNNRIQRFDLINNGC